jgi:serine/threonine-protein kinase
MAMIESIGKYRILAPIGRGRMGTVYKALDPLLKRTVAIKVISEELDVTAELKARFFREAQACAKLSHPNIVTVYDLGAEQDHLFIVMEFLDGEEMRQIIAQRKPLSIEHRLGLMVQVCNGLAYAHQKGIVHRDIKPANLYVTAGGVVKIMDFGIAKLTTDEDNLTRTGLIMGTLRYIAPEQARGRVDHRADIFSAAAVCYELLAYHPPLRDADPMSILEELGSTASPSVFRPDPAIPDDVAAVIERALCKNPSERFANIEEMGAALEAARGRLRGLASSLREHVLAQMSRSRELEVLLFERIGRSPGPASRPPTEQESAADLERLGQEAETRVVRLRGLLERADTAAPRFEQALDDLRQGKAQAAVHALERILADLPEHAHARDALEQARAELRHAAAKATTPESPSDVHNSGTERIQPSISSQTRATGLTNTDDDARTVLIPRSASPAVERTTPLVAERAGTLPLDNPTDSTDADVPLAHTSTQWWIRLWQLARQPWALGATALAVAAIVAYVMISPTLIASHRWQLQLDDARKRVSAVRAEAVKVEANILAPSEFDQATAEVDRANQLTSARRFAEAIETLRGAVARYENGIRAAITAREARAKADAARTSMRGVKEQAAQGAGPFNEALEQEREGDDRYKQLAFDEAAARFRAAEDLYTKSIQSPPPKQEEAPPEDLTAGSDTAIRDALTSYTRAFETKDIRLLQGVRPGLRPEELSRYRDTFDQTKSYRLNLKVDRITVAGDAAEARGRRDDIVVSKNGETVRSSSPFSFRLKRVGGRWTIDAVK